MNLKQITLDEKEAIISTLEDEEYPRADKVSDDFLEGFKRGVLLVYSGSISPINESTCLYEALDQS